MLFSVGSEAGAPGPFIGHRLGSFRLAPAILMIGVLLSTPFLTLSVIVGGHSHSLRSTRSSGMGGGRQYYLQKVGHHPLYDYAPDNVNEDLYAPLRTYLRTYSTSVAG